MGQTNGVFKIAAAQFAPVFLDKKATVDKACDLIDEAGRKGASLVVFPESFIPAYPDWVWTVPGGKKALLNEMYARLMENAVSVPDDSTNKLCRAAKNAKIHVAMGINERNTDASNASLFNTILYIDSSGNVLGRHRKLVPTGGERLVWAQGDGSTLVVYDTPFGKLGGLICWENYMPLARNAMYAAGTQIYIAPTWDSGETWLATLRHIAKEGGTFVIGCCMAIHKNDIPDHYEFKRLYSSEKEWINPGGSCIISPDGKVIAGPVDMKEELILAETDLNLIPASKWILDVAGHYARPDVFKFTVNREPNMIMRNTLRNNFQD